MIRTASDKPSERGKQQEKERCEIPKGQVDRLEKLSKGMCLILGLGWKSRPVGQPLLFGAVQCTLDTSSAAVCAYVWRNGAQVPVFGLPFSFYLYSLKW